MEKIFVHSVYADRIEFAYENILTMKKANSTLACSVAVQRVVQ